jgi:biotin transporter BioY
MKYLWRYLLMEVVVGGLISWLTGEFTSLAWATIPATLTICLMGITLYAFMLGEPSREYGEDYAEDTMR